MQNLFASDYVIKEKSQPTLLCVSIFTRAVGFPEHFSTGASVAQLCKPPPGLLFILSFTRWMSTLLLIPLLAVRFLQWLSEVGSFDPCCWACWHCSVCLMLRILSIHCLGTCHCVIRCLSCTVRLK